MYIYIYTYICIYVLIYTYMIDIDDSTDLCIYECRKITEYEYDIGGLILMDVYHGIFMEYDVLMR